MAEMKFRRVHTLPHGADFRFLPNGDMVVCHPDRAPCVVHPDGTQEELTLMNTPRIDKPSLLTNRKDEPAFPQQRLQPGPAGALKPVEIAQRERLENARISHMAARDAGGLV